MLAVIHRLLLAVVAVAVSSVHAVRGLLDVDGPERVADPGARPEDGDETEGVGAEGRGDVHGGASLLGWRRRRRVMRNPWLAT